VSPSDDLLRRVTRREDLSRAGRPFDSLRALDTEVDSPRVDTLDHLFIGGGPVLRHSHVLHGLRPGLARDRLRLYIAAQHVANSSELTMEPSSMEYSYT
jgi:hypothetical protein